MAEFVVIVGRVFVPAAGFQPAGPPERRLQPGLAAPLEETTRFGI